MIAIAITIIVCITAVTITAMICQSKQNKDRQKAIVQELTKRILDKAVEDGMQ